MSEFVKLCDAEEVGENEMKRYEHAGLYVAVINSGGQFFVVEDSCPHAGAPMSQGYLEGHNLTCCWHAWTFDIRNGACDMIPSVTLPRFEAEVRGGELWVSREPVASEGD